MIRVGVCASGGGGLFRSICSSRHAGVSYEVKSLLVDRECKAIAVGADFSIPTVIVPDKNSLAQEFTRVFADCDLIVLAGFLRIIPEDVCNNFGSRIINCHPSLLPKHSGIGMFGVDVQKSVLESADEFAGLTIHYVVPVVDSGEIISQLSFRVPDGISAWELGGLVFNLESVVLPEVIHSLVMKKTEDELSPE